MMEIIQCTNLYVYENRKTIYKSKRRINLLAKIS